MYKHLSDWHQLQQQTFNSWLTARYGGVCGSGGRADFDMQTGGAVDRTTPAPPARMSKLPPMCVSSVRERVGV